MKLSTEQLARLSRLLDDVIDLDAAGRVTWLQALPPQHRDLEPALRQALQEGTASGASTCRLLPRLAGRAAASRWRAGAPVGPYRLIRPLGAGGMAEVWLAERADGAFRREVALKMPARLAGRDDLVQRFAVERDILAALEHPRIARFYDAGVSEDGTPYLALEYVAGTDLLRWADERRLGLRERIGLFLQVLEAVQYAHDRGVLHRDLKPGNVLVTGTGQVHLLDFGVARRMAAPAEGDLTRLYGRPLTPGYASPEQLQGQALGAASDVYSLGVMLYALLSGRVPFDPAARASAPGGATEPPSARIDADTAQRRASSPRRLVRLLEGDLDAIVLKALSPLPSDRYASAAALARDLRRHLDGEAVRAVPPSLPYRTGKFLRRHRTAGAAALAVAALGIGAGYHATLQRPPAAGPAAAPAVARASETAPAERPRHPRITQPDPEAYDLVRQGDVYANGPFERDAQRAEALFRRAIAVDPDYAVPWVKLGLLQLRQARLSSATANEARAEARRAIETALGIDPHLLAAHAAWFRYLVLVEHRWADARAALDRMRAIDPDDARSLPECEATFASVTGRLDEAVRIQRQIVERDPLDAAAHGVLASYLLQGDRFEESLALLHAALRLNPHASGTRGLIGVNLALLGHAEPALAEIARERHDGSRLWASSIAHWMAGRAAEAEAALDELKRHPHAHGYAIAQLYALQGNSRSAFEWLDRACAERQQGCETLRTDRFLRGLRGEPRYRALLAKMKLDAEP